ncbi:response regulator receiver protein [Microbulbifer sp. SSSA007]|uniref:response regulator receiver protein n=1 Tax=Microbulbifer sp. SSSA007 TaxID=3243379 RepID=UPI00403954ED
MKKILLLLCGFLLPAICNAEFYWHTSKIKAVYPLADGNFVLQFENESSDCPGQFSPKYHYVSVGESGVTQEGSEKIYSAALSAAMANKQVRINFDGSQPNCFINRLIIDF